MAIPNHIIQFILEEILNQVIDLNHFNYYFRRYTLISKQWNKEIIVKLRIFKPIRIHFSVDDATITNWIEMAKKYAIDYQIKVVKAVPIDCRWLEMLKDKVIDITKKDISSGDNCILDTYPQLKNLNFNMNTEGYISTLTKLNKRSEDITNYSVTINGEYSVDNERLQVTTPQVIDALFNQNIFNSISVVCSNIMSPISPRLPTGHQCSNLTSFFLCKLIISHQALSTILDLSTHLQEITIEEIDISPVTTFDWVLEKLVKLESLSDIKLDIEFSTNFDAIISFLNKTKSAIVFVTFRKILYLSAEQVLSAQVDNGYIQDFYFMVMDGFFPFIEQFSDYTLLPRWKHKSNLKKVSFFEYYKGFDNEVEGMTNLEFLYIKLFDNFKEQKLTQNSLDRIFEFNLKVLTKLGIIYTRTTTLTDNVVVRPDKLLLNRYLKSLCLSSTTWKDYSLILGCKHPTIVEMTINYLTLKPGDNFEDLIVILKENNTLTRVQIHSANFQQLDESDPNRLFNTVYFSIEILKTNRSLVELTLPSFGHFKSHFVSKYDKVLSRNHIIRQVCIQHTFPGMALEKQKIRSDLIDVFNKYSIRYRYG
ncbi:hypothetical protein DLAC_04443 [Tieghemostelium lacteum]|uniref:Uncharacterized protein n=1 Tax=Tieghemostelium lacteum TaxID=361077 RepID=A0A151ZK13_TIELA|nr:hypothetical protein DLAC_04443 [Tieghemostelium lacteum]|eukprot:KYQ94154.1 hypothetical protein DLAC_04443 [Tieghemostelium lacteum]